MHSLGQCCCGCAAAAAAESHCSCEGPSCPSWRYWCTWLPPFGHQVVWDGLHLQLAWMMNVCFELSDQVFAWFRSLSVAAVGFKWLHQTLFERRFDAACLLHQMIFWLSPL